MFVDLLISHREANVLLSWFGLIRMQIDLNLEENDRDISYLWS